VSFLEDNEYFKMYKLEETHWWFKSRRKLIFELLKKIKYRNNVLDIGCGTGYNLLYFKPLFKNVIGMDISKNALLLSSKRRIKNLFLGDAKRISISNNSVDVVLSLDLIEHIKDDNIVISEIHRILRKNGTLILSVPAFNFLWSKHDDLLHHKRRYNKSQIHCLLTKNGFKVEKISYWNFFLFPLISIYKLLNVGGGSDIKKTRNIINIILSFILSVECFLIKYLNLPFGISIIAVAKRL